MDIYDEGDRLDCARLLLKEDGVLVCAIDENEVATLKLLLESFGDEFTVDVVTIVQNPRGNLQGNNFHILMNLHSICL